MALPSYIVQLRSKNGPKKDSYVEIKKFRREKGLTQEAWWNYFLLFFSITSPIQGRRVISNYENGKITQGYLKDLSYAFGQMIRKFNAKLVQKAKQMAKGPAKDKTKAKASSSVQKNTQATPTPQPAREYGPRTRAVVKTYGYPLATGFGYNPKGRKQLEPIQVSSETILNTPLCQFHPVHVSSSRQESIENIPPTSKNHLSMSFEWIVDPSDIQMLDEPSTSKAMNTPSFPAPIPMNLKIETPDIMDEPTTSRVRTMNVEWMDTLATPTFDAPSTSHDMMMPFNPPTASTPLPLLESPPVSNSSKSAPKRCSSDPGPVHHATKKRKIAGLLKKKRLSDWDVYYTRKLLDSMAPKVHQELDQEESDVEPDEEERKEDTALPAEWVMKVRQMKAKELQKNPCPPMPARIRNWPRPPVVRNQEAQGTR